MEEVISSSREDIYKQFEEFFSTVKKDELAELASTFPEPQSLEVDFNELDNFNSDFADSILNNPDKYTTIAEDAMASLNTHALIVPKEQYKPKLRIYNLPDIYNVSVQNLGAGNLDKLVKVEGAVSWITDIYPRIQNAVWECVHCWQITTTKPQKIDAVKPPLQCKCGRNHFKLLEEKSTFINMQRSRMQEMVEKLKGSMPSSHVDLWFENDLVNQVSPGEKLMVTGILRLKPNKEGKSKSTVYSKYLDVLHIAKVQQEFESIEISKEEEKQIKEIANSHDVFEKIVKSVAPSIYGYNELKQAVALQLFGGTPGKKLPDGHTIRNDVHILLCGDPGCLVADERVVLGNGAIVKIGEMGKQHLEKINLKVQTGEGGAKRDAATVFHYYKNQPVMEIITESGKSIKGTYNHPLLCGENYNGALVRKWKQLDHFKRGDKVAAVTGIKCNISAFLPTDFKRLEYCRGPKFKGKLPLFVNVALAELLGYLLGDGWVRKKEACFVVAEPEKDILPLLLEKCHSLFGIKPHVTTRIAKGRSVPLHYVLLSSSDVAHNLIFLREKRVPNLILQSGNKVAAAFLKWLFEADGTVFNNGRGRRAVGLKAKNIELLRDVQVLLLRFGIHSRIIENALLIRRGRDIIKFSEKIGFVSKKKTTKLKELAKNAKQFARSKSQRFEKIVEIRYHPPEDVFDIEVPKSHRFIANGVISHNTGKSAILQYVVRLAPKGIFTSGKGSSAVGMTASAEKDELTGGWILKAGAMVLGSGGIVMIDEFDKMDAEDRGALHESMEQQKISIAKAGILTTFQTKAAVLAAANPKYGRFDPNAPTSGQFDIPPTLLSRFDLIFAIKDVLDEAHDRKLAEHIVTGHTYGNAKQTPVGDSAILPSIESDLLRKYIAYARRNVFPVLTPEASEKIKDFYLELRRLGKKSNTFPITARQIEGVIRLSEASAKVRLSPRVELQDAERAIGLVTFVLHDVFMDKETGAIDSDIISIGQPKSKVDKLRTLMNVISSLEKQFDIVDMEEIIKECSQVNIDEHAVRKMIDDLKRNGDLYEPKPGYVKTARRKGEW